MGSEARVHRGSAGRPAIARILVVLPTYREAANISDALTGIRTALRSAHALVVDDEGGDGTAERAEGLGRELGSIEVIRRSGKRGLASAYLAGFEWAIREGYDIVVGMDADLSHDPTALPRLVQAVTDGADVSVGSRYVPGGSTVNWPMGRRLMSRGGNWYASHALATGVADMTSAFRAYRVDALQKVALGELRAEGYGFLLELIHRLRRNGAHVVEVPIVFADRVRGNSKMSLPIAVEAFRIVTAIAVHEGPGRWRRRPPGQPPTTRHEGP